MSDRDLDRDLAILLVTAPLWLAAFVGLAVLGAIADAWRVRS